LTKLLPDTNVLVYETVEDSEHHAEASRIMEEAEGIYIPLIVLHEYVWVMLKLSVDPNFISLKLREYYEDPRVKYVQESPEIIQEALHDLKEKNLNPKQINDLIILSIAKKHSLALFTFDRELIALAYRKGVETIKFNP
jgi:predicted nucleic acid-binding protein